MQDQLDKLESLLNLVDTKSTLDDFMVAFEAVLKFVENNHNATQEQLAKIAELSKQEIQKVKDFNDTKWNKVMSHVSTLKDGEPGKDGVDSFIPGPKGDKGDPGEPGKDGEPGTPGLDSAETPDELIAKVNTAKTLIKRERVEGLADIERMAKANSNFNPAMGPSFADLKNLGDRITTLSNTVTTEAKFSINFIIDGGGSAITTGVKGFVEIPYALTITGWQVFADQVGSVVVDVWKDTYANFPPTVADTITGSEKPTLTSAQSNQDLNLSTWTTSASIGDVLAFNVDSVSTITRLTVSIIGIKQ